MRYSMGGSRCGWSIPAREGWVGCWCGGLSALEAVRSKLMGAPGDVGLREFPGKVLRATEDDAGPFGVFPCKLEREEFD